MKAGSLAGSLTRVPRMPLLLPVAGMYHEGKFSVNFWSKGKVQRHSSWEMLLALTPDAQGMVSHLLSVLEEKLEYTGSSFWTLML